MKRLLLILSCLFAQPAWAENSVAGTITPEEREQLLDRAESLKAQSAQIKEAAQKKRAEADTACWKKTLVSACMNDARREYLDSMASSRKLDVEAKQIEREVRSRDLATKRARRAEEAPIKRAETERKIAREQAKAAGQQQSREAKAAEREQEAQQGSARARELERERQQKLETRRKKEEKAERKALEREKKDRKRAEERARLEERARQQGM